MNRNQLIGTIVLILISGIIHVFISFQLVGFLTLDVILIFAIGQFFYGILIYGIPIFIISMIINAIRNYKSKKESQTEKQTIKINTKLNDISNLKYCSDCGKEIKKGTIFCEFCGKKQ